MSGDFRARCWHIAMSELLCLLFLAPRAVLAEDSRDNACGPLYTQHYGPYDYRTQKPKLEIVHIAHFTPVVESLIRGQTGVLGLDLQYTLRASPNHHRALAAITKWGMRLKRGHLPDMEYSIDCWFERALRFAPDDHVARSLYAHYAGLSGRKQEAVAQLDRVLQQVPDNALSIFNAGLIFFELGVYDRALEAAHRSRELGYLRPDLEVMLKKAGQWQDAKP